MLKSLSFAMIALGCSIGIATAQEAAPPGPGPVDPAQLKRLLPQQGSASNPAALGGGGATLNAAGAVPTGWNYFHAYYCQWFIDGSNNYLYVFPTTGGFWFIRNNTYGADTFLSGCVNGNWEAVHVINGTTGEFDSIYTYSYK